MAQLIKLQDYVSRYERNIFQYPPKYMRLKSVNWEKMRDQFERGLLHEESTEEEKTEKPTKWNKLLQRLKVEEAEESNEKASPYIPQTLKELKQFFLDGLIPFQLKWASTTLQDKSFLAPAYYEESVLKYFLQRFPDTYLLMYKPIVEMKKAHMELEHIMIGPFGIEIITYLTAPHGELVHPSSEKSWYIEENGVPHRRMNPLIPLRRSETFVKSVLRKYDLDFPFRKVVLAPDLTFMEGQEPYQTVYIGQDKYVDWFKEKRQIKSPLKHDQLKVAEALLKHSRTTSVRRPEWDYEESLMEE
ncbi:NERD domain-containing protein [Halobacillus sp. H74]|uniref:NERD domain-containing protein n=1 Tax=Halobacillus sp. H74 TaxID=3457436 RepID=UPI003FCE8A75